MIRHLLLVSRFFPQVYQYAREHFADETGVEVVLDRRRGQRRRAPATVDTDRRCGERRSRQDVDVALKSEAQAFLTLETPDTEDQPQAPTAATKTQSR